MKKILIFLSNLTTAIITGNKFINNARIVNNLKLKTKNRQTLPKNPPLFNNKYGFLRFDQSNSQKNNFWLSNHKTSMEHVFIVDEDG